MVQIVANWRWKWYVRRELVTIRSLSITKHKNNQTVYFSGWSKQKTKMDRAGVYLLWDWTTKTKKMSVGCFHVESLSNGVHRGPNPYPLHVCHQSKPSLVGSVLSCSATVLSRVVHSSYFHQAPLTGAHKVNITLQLIVDPIKINIIHQYRNREKKL